MSFRKKVCLAAIGATAWACIIGFGVLLFLFGEIEKISWRRRAVV